MYVFVRARVPVCQQRCLRESEVASEVESESEVESAVEVVPIHSVATSQPPDSDICQILIMRSDEHVARRLP